MIKATAKNEIQRVLEEYLGNRKAAKVAETVYAVVQTETEHIHNGKHFFVHEDSNGVLMLARESMVKEKVKTVLFQNLEKDEVLECLEQLMAEITEIETIFVEGSDSQIYSKLLKHKPADKCEEEFLKNLNWAVKTGFNFFKVPVYDPSIDEKGRIHFVAGKRPAVGYSYNELKELARINGLRLGKKREYVPFLGTIIYRLIEDGWSEYKAFHVVCSDSTELGHYHNSENAKKDFELTGSRKIAGKCDLANTGKILAAEDERNSGFWVGGGNCHNDGCDVPLARLCYYKFICNCPNDDSVGDRAS